MLKQGDLFETSYRDNNGNVIIEQYTYKAAARQTSEVVDNKKELAEELNSLTKELKELMGDISPQINLKEESVFEYISDLTLIEDTKLKNSKEAELKKNFGEGNVERANAINANFDTIIEEINKSGINIFFDPKTNKHQNGCD